MPLSSNNETLFIIGRSTRLIINIFFQSRFKKIKFDIYIYIHIVLAPKMLSLGICSCEMEYLLIISPNSSSTLKIVFFISSFVINIMIVNLFQLLRFFLIYFFINRRSFQCLLI